MDSISRKRATDGEIGTEETAETRIDLARLTKRRADSPGLGFGRRASVQGSTVKKERVMPADGGIPRQLRRVFVCGRGPCIANRVRVLLRPRDTAQRRQATRRPVPTARSF
jgi:hypothetical protein